MRRASHGFTLIELIVVIIILGALAGLAVPRYIAISTAARVSAVRSMAAVLQSTAENVRVACRLDPSCDYTAQGQHLVIGGRAAYLSYGWLLSGYIEPGTIDTWVDITGFSVLTPAVTITLFQVDGAPDPANCSVRYDNPNNRGPTSLLIVTVTTTGC